MNVVGKIIICSCVLLANYCTAQLGRNTIFCYYDQQAIRRPEVSQVDPSDLDPTLCSHIAYSFFGVTPEADIKFRDRFKELGEGQLEEFLELREDSPRVKLIASIGGPKENSTILSQIMYSSSLRGTFVTNIIKFLRRHRFNGVDIHWLYPAQDGGIPSDKESFATFIKELGPELKKRQLLLTVSVGARKNHIYNSYDVPILSEHADLINVLAFGYHNPSGNKTGHPSPLFSDPTTDASDLNINYSISKWIEAGADHSKLTLIISFSAISFHLEDEAKNGLGDNAVTIHPSVPNWPKAGHLRYVEVCTRLQNGPSWKRTFNSVQKVSFAHRKHEWIGFESPKSVHAKARYAFNNELAGVGVWTVDQDDIYEYCFQGNWPLLTIINSVISI